MLLPKDILQQLSYYESKTLVRDGYEYSDYIIIHFKSWWKRKKVFKFQCRKTLNDDGNYNIHTTGDWIELKDQLDEYFQSEKEEFKLNV